MFSFSSVPLQLILYGAIGCGALGGIMLLISIVLAILSVDVQTILILGVMFLLCCLILLSQSLLGQYISRIYLTQNQMPQYTAREVVTKKFAEEESVREFAMQ